MISGINIPILVEVLLLVVLFALLALEAIRRNINTVIVLAVVIVAVVIVFALVV